MRDFNIFNERTNNFLMMKIGLKSSNLKTWINVMSHWLIYKNGSFNCHESVSIQD